MNPFILIILMTALCGCSVKTNEPSSSPPPVRITADDIKLAQNFLDALLRPNSTDFRVIVDGSSERIGHTRLKTINQDLSERLDILREPPSQILRMNVRSTDLPKPWGSGNFVFSYDTSSGQLSEIGLFKWGEKSADFWIRIVHWPDGTRLVSMNFTWIKDSKSNIFHLRSGEKTFRFVIAARPVC